MEENIDTQRQRLRDPAVFAWLRLARVFQKIDARSERFFRTVGMNTGQFDILAQVGARSGITQQELADALLVTKGNISQLLAKMEQDGLIVRRQQGRRNCLSLAARGEALYNQIVPQQESLIATMLAALSSQEQQDLLRLLRKLDQAIEP